MELREMHRISPDELNSRMTHEQALVVLDVRTEDALSADPFQIPGSRWLPRAELVQQANTIPRHATVVIYCT